MNTSSDLSASSTILLMTLAGGRYTASNVPVTANSYFSIGAGVPTALIGNFVWIDTNKNGIQDGGEA